MTSLFGFQLWQTCERSHGECQESHQQAWFILWLCIAQSIYTNNSKWIIWPFTLGCFVVLSLLCSTTGFRLKVTVGRRCWTSTGTKQRSWKGNFFFFIVVLWLLLYNSVLNNVLFIHCRKVEQGLEKGVSLNSASVAQSSQYHLIQSKPDYHSLCRQQPLLQAMEIIVSWKFDRF